MTSEDVDYDGPLPPMPSMVVMPWEDKTDRLVFNDHRRQKRMVDEAVKDRVDFEYSPDTPEVEERNAKERQAIRHSHRAGERKVTVAARLFDDREGCR